MTVHLIILTMFWFLAVAAAIGAMLMSLEDAPRRSALSACLAVVSLGIGYVGFGRWSPFRFFPQVGWVWSEGDEQIYLASNWFFVAPLLLGLTALGLLIFQRLMTARPARLGN